MRKTPTTPVIIAFNFLFALGFWTSAFGFKPPIPEKLAINKAMNRIESCDNRVKVSNLNRFEVNIDENGFIFSPAKSELAWNWQLNSIRSGSIEYFSMDECQLPSVTDGKVTINHGQIQELYLPQRAAIEQQFILSKKINEGNQDLLIQGAILCDGEFAKEKQGWIWRSQDGVVTLGKVTVFDAHGSLIPATMQVAFNQTSIIVDGDGLANASYPVTIDPEVGADDFRISNLGPANATTHDAIEPAVAYNATDNEYLIAWSGDTIQDDEEIFIQRINAATGALLGGARKISSMNVVGNASFDAYHPSIAWNATDNEYLVVWHGDSLTNGKFNIYGQRISNGGAEVGPNDFQISFLASASTSYDSYDPDISWSSATNEYLVVWTGDLTSGKEVIWGQMIASNGSLVNNNFIIGEQGASSSYDAVSPAIAFNSVDLNFMVAWHGDTIPGEDEIYVRVVDTNGNPLGTSNRISHAGPDGNANLDALEPDIAYNADSNEFLVVWHADPEDTGMAAGEFEVFGQVIDANGQEIGPDDFRISHTEPFNSGGYDAYDASVGYSSSCQEYLVVWHADDTTDGHDGNENEIYLQQITPDGTEELDDIRISEMGVLGDDLYDGQEAVLAYNSNNNEYLIVWRGDDNVSSVDGEEEIWGQRWLCEPPCVPPTFASGGGQTDTLCFGDDITYSVTTNGDLDNLQWQVSTNGGTTWTNISDNNSYTGSTTASLTVDNIPATWSGYQYRAVAFGCTIQSDVLTANTLLLDSEAPAVTCPGDIIEQPTTFDCEVLVSWTDPVPTDNCSATVSSVPANGSSFGVGTTTVTVTADDGVNQTNCTFDVTVNQPIIAGDITQNVNQLCSSSTGTGYTYQWSLNGAPISGATSSCYTISQTGNYSVEITDPASGCVGVSDTTIFIVGIEEQLIAGLKIFPVPASQVLNMQVDQPISSDLQLRLQSVDGRMVRELALSKGTSKVELELSGVEAGVYFLVLEGNGSVVRKVLVQ